MNPRETLAAQTTALLADVRGERSKLDTRLQQAGTANGGTPVAQEVFHLLRARLNARMERLRELIESIKHAGELSGERSRYRKLEGECRDLFGECLAVFTAEAIRTLKLDGGACDIIERLLRGVGTAVGVPWPHVTALAEAEFFATASQIVRLRYPVASVWDLPVAAHEFGHFVGPRWPSSGMGEATPYQRFLDVENLGPPSHLGEYFADMFATFALGPAYVDSCLLRRFDPAAEGDASHPSDRERAEWILAGLELLTEAAEQEKPGSVTHLFLARTARQRRLDWDEAVTANGGQPLDAARAGKTPGACADALERSLRLGGRCRLQRPYRRAAAVRTVRRRDATSLRRGSGKDTRHSERGMGAASGE